MRVFIPDTKFKNGLFKNLLSEVYVFYMYKKKSLSVFLCLTLIISALSFSAGALTTFNTQYSYDESNPSWLSDLIVIESVSVDTAISGELNLISAVTDYPYSETADTFKENVYYYELLYTLDEDAANAAYLYAMEYLNLFSEATETNVSDEFIAYWLTQQGVEMPDEMTTEDLIVARTLYSIMTSNDYSYEIVSGTDLDTAIMAYLSNALGVDLSSIQTFSDTSLTSIYEYVMAVCRYTLYLQGYDVSTDTDDDAVARLIAIYTIEMQGIAVDEENITMDELRLLYLATMLGVTYDITVDTTELEAAENSDTLATYILRLVAKEYGLAASATLSYEETFEFVRDNTDYFDLEDNEFYADIMEYNAQLEYRRSYIYIYLTAVESSSYVDIYVDGEEVSENVFNRIALDTDLDEQTLTIKVTYTYLGEVTTSYYYINITQGEDTGNTDNDSIISDILEDSQTAISSILDSLGSSSVVASIFSIVSFLIPDRILSVMSLMIPSFISTATSGYEYIMELFGFSDPDDTGTIETTVISGVSGLESYISASATDLSVSFSTETLSITSNSTSTVYSGVTTSSQTVTITVNEDDDVANTSSDTSEEEEGSTLSSVLLGIALVVLAIAIIALGIALAYHLNVKSKTVGDSKHRSSKKRK